jgi:hypothetical protein
MKTLCCTYPTAQGLSHVKSEKNLVLDEGELLRITDAFTHESAFAHTLRVRASRISHQPLDPPRRARCETSCAQRWKSMETFGLVIICVISWSPLRRRGNKLSRWAVLVF